MKRSSAAKPGKVTGVPDLIDMNSHTRRQATLLLGNSNASNMESDDPTSFEEEAGQPPLNELVSLQEACLLAYISAFGIDDTISRIHRNDMAESLSQLLTVYSVSEDRQSIRRLTSAELRDGIFADGGRVVRFRDEREPITGLAVTRTALKAAVAALKDTRKPSGFHGAP